jgi:probable rRNA maturation factor
MPKETLVEVEISIQNCFDESNRETITTETWEDWFKQWLQLLETLLPPAAGYELSLRLVDDTEMQQLNAQYRHKNQPTDVLSFAALEVDVPLPEEMRSQLPLYLGDIVISVDTAFRQAVQQGHSLATELAWLATHGLLHLLGWDHPDEESLTEMLQKQTILLGIIGYKLG